MEEHHWLLMFRVGLSMFGGSPTRTGTQMHFPVALCLPQRAESSLSNRLPYMLGKPGEQGEPGILRHLAGTQQAPPAAQSQGRELCPAQSATGTVKPRTGLIFALRSLCSCPRLVWKVLTLGKKGTSKVLLHSIRSCRLMAWPQRGVSALKVTNARSCETLA